uniref:PR domain zinc finger protein 1 n=1 Tax=Cacopsylla melanoneura TaxID=428564 RepID=A0A8D8VBR5_9HEMI
MESNSHHQPPTTPTPGPPTPTPSSSASHMPVSPEVSTGSEPSASPSEPSAMSPNNDLSTGIMCPLSPSMIFPYNGPIFPFQYNEPNTEHHYSCRHCNNFSTFDINEIVDHCKTCAYMSRPDLKKYKYVCYDCNFGFHQMAHLKRHFFTHTGEKPYNCIYCTYSSTHKYNIQKHLNEKHVPVKTPKPKQDRRAPKFRKINTKGRKYNHDNNTKPRKAKPPV